MPVQLKVKEMMIPIEDYAVTTAEKSLKEAVPELMKIYCQVETGKCTEAGHRASLVLDAQSELVGILDFKKHLESADTGNCRRDQREIACTGCFNRFCRSRCP